jgi:outer membrane cobalamin receptor
MVSCALALMLSLATAIPLQQSSDPAGLKPAPAGKPRLHKEQGQVVDPDGRPVPRVAVVIDGPLGARAVRTDADGRFVVPPDLPPGTYRLLVDADGFTAEPATLQVPSEAQPLTIALRIAPVSDAVVVSAAQVPRPLSESPAAATVIARDDIQLRQLENVADAVRTVPGFTVGRNGGRGALTSVFPRGGESDYTLVLVDGIRINAFGGGFDFSLLPFGDVEQVEVVRGPQSAVFGSDAIGGIVSVTTRHGGSPTGSASIEGGSQAMVRATAGGTATAGQWSFGGGAEHTGTDGFTGTAPATGEQVSNDDWHSSTAAANVSWSRSPMTLVRGDYRWLDSERGNPGPYGSNPIGVYTAVDRVSRGFDTHQQSSLQARFPWGSVLSGRIQQRLQVTYADLDNRFHSSFGDSFFETRRTTARAQTDLAATTSTGVSFGVEGLSERARGTYFTGETAEPVPVERRTVGAFGEVRQQVGARVSLTAGLRVDSIRQDALEGDPFAFAPRPAFAEETVNSVNPRASAALVVWQDASGAARTKLRVSAGTGIRPPDAFEIAFTDNPSLEPERSRSVDVAVSHQVTTGLTADASLFFNRYDDLIVAVGGSLSGASRYRTDNISNARARGLEIGLAWRGPHGLSARGSYTFLDTEVLAVDNVGAAPPPFTVGDPLLRRPRHQGSVDLLWTRNALSAFAEVRARGEVLDVEPSFGALGGLFESAGFTVVDAGATWRFAHGIEAFARALNLLDRPYEEFLGYPAPGRLGVVGVRIAVRP